MNGTHDFLNPKFFVGLHQRADAKHFMTREDDGVFISRSRLDDKKSGFTVGNWIMDSGAFKEIELFGGYRHTPEEYAEVIDRLRSNGNMLCAAIQDYMCEEFMLQRTGLTVRDHQRMTIERYDALRPLTDAPLLIVIQGYEAEEYVQHLDDYGSRIQNGAWIGVGSVCKRNGNPELLEPVFTAIKKHRPDLRLHGFGLKITALESPLLRRLLYSADSMAWSDGARHRANPMQRALEKEFDRKMMPSEARAIYQDRGIHMPNPNDWREARKYVSEVKAIYKGATSPYSQSEMILEN